MLEFALDLTWVRHKIVGGTESYVNNLIRGFQELDAPFRLVMIAAKDNAHLFEQYVGGNISLKVARVHSASVPKRILWQNFHLSSFIKKQGLSLCLEPVYAKPILNNGGIRYLTVIHDLEALQFPENHGWLTNLWLRICWRNTARTSKHVVAISNYVKEDIIRVYAVPEDRISTIYDPIVLDVSNQCAFEEVQKMYGVEDKGYYYTVSKLNPHKNLTTLVKVFGEIKKRNIEGLPCKILISGVNGGMVEQLNAIAKEYDLTEELTLTGFVYEDVRNCLYAHAKAFLFPSIFEGFGMPPVEAICAGTPVVTTKATCIPEITQHLANYVEDPLDVEAWILALQNVENRTAAFRKDVYAPATIAKQFLEQLKKL